MCSWWYLMLLFLHLSLIFNWFDEWSKIYPNTNKMAKEHYTVKKIAHNKIIWIGRRELKVLPQVLFWPSLPVSYQRCDPAFYRKQCMLGVSALHRVFLHRKMQHISFAPTPKQTEQEVATTMFSSKLVPCLTTLQQNQKEADPLSHRHHPKSGSSRVTCSHPHLLPLSSSSTWDLTCSTMCFSNALSAFVLITIQCRKKEINRKISAWVEVTILFIRNEIISNKP
jgi:hypothetical protein